MNFANTSSPYFGSGNMDRLSADLLRDMVSVSVYPEFKKN